MDKEYDALRTRYARAVMAKPTEWQCDCGAWVPIGYSRHMHVVAQPLSAAEIIERRRLAAVGIPTVLELENLAVTNVLRESRHATR